MDRLGLNAACGETLRQGEVLDLGTLKLCSERDLTDMGLRPAHAGRIAAALRPPPGLRAKAAPAATEAEAAMRAFVRELGLSEDHAPWLLTETCQSPEQLKHVSLEAMVRLGLPPRTAATIRAAVGTQPPEEYFCSISCELMVDPCFAADGHSYERENITAWLVSHDTSPLTNETLPHKMVVPNHSLKALIWGFRDP